MATNKPDQIITELVAAITARCRPLSAADKDTVLAGLHDAIHKQQNRRRGTKTKPDERRYREHPHAVMYWRPTEVSF